MADISVQRGEVTLSGTSTTLTAGSDYTAPASDSVAFCRLTNHYPAGFEPGGSNEPVDNWTARPVWSDITSSITIQRDSTASSCTVTWEIWEFTASGANEFVVRDVLDLTIADTNTSVDSAAITGISTDADVVPWICGVESGLGVDASADDISVTTEWLSASDKVRVERTGSGGTLSVTVAVVEFVGSNWTVQRATHSYSAAGSVETETITSVGATSRAIIHPQLRTSQANLDESGQEVWLSGTTQLSFQLQSGAGVGHTAVVWVIDNSDTSSGAMSVQRISGSRGDNSPASPDSWTETITAVSALADASITGISTRSSGAGAATNRSSVNMELTGTSTVTLKQSDGGQTQTYRFEVVEWPTAAAGGGTTVTPDPVTATFSTPTPTVSPGPLSLTPDPVTAAFAASVPALSGALTLTPSPATAAWSVPSPNLAIGEVTLLPAAVTASWDVPAPTIDSGQQVMTPDAVQAALSAPDPSLVIGELTLNPDAVTAAWSVQDPEVLGALALTPDAVAAAWALPAPSVNVGPVVLLPDPVTAQWGVFLPTVVGGDPVGQDGSFYYRMYRRKLRR